MRAFVHHHEAPPRYGSFMYVLFKSGLLAPKIKKNISLQIDAEKTGFRD